MATAYLNCATGTLDTYIPSAEEPWNEQRIKHLYRRIGFGANAQMIGEAMAMTPADLVDQLIDGAINEANWTKPVWGDWAISDYDQNCRVGCCTLVSTPE